MSPISPIGLIGLMGPSRGNRSDWIISLSASANCSTRSCWIVKVERRLPAVLVGYVIIYPADRRLGRLAVHDALHDYPQNAVIRPVDRLLGLDELAETLAQTRRTSS